MLKTQHFKKSSGVYLVLHCSLPQGGIYNHSIDLGHSLAKPRFGRLLQMLGAFGIGLLHEEYFDLQADVSMHA